MTQADDKQAFELSTDDRTIIAAALADLAKSIGRDVAEAPVAQKIASLRTLLSHGIAPMETPPPSVKINEATTMRMLSALDTATSWRLKPEYDRSPNTRTDTYKLVAQLEFENGARDLTFDLASGLQMSSHRLRRLEEDHAAFFAKIEQRMADVAGWDSQIAYHVFEIPVPWDFMPDEEPEDRAAAYVEQNGGPIIAVNYIYMADNSNDTLWGDYVGCHCEISGFPDEIDQLREWLPAHIEGITSSKAVAHP